MLESRIDLEGGAEVAPLLVEPLLENFICANPFLLGKRLQSGWYRSMQ